MLRTLKLLFLVLVLLAGLAFHLRNRQLVVLDIYAASLELSLSLVVVLALLLGAALGMAVSLLAMLPLRRENVRLRHQARVAEQEVNNLRAIPIKNAP